MDGQRVLLLWFATSTQLSIIRDPLNKQQPARTSNGEPETFLSGNKRRDLLWPNPPDLNGAADPKSPSLWRPSQEKVVRPDVAQISSSHYCQRASAHWSLDWLPDCVNNIYRFIKYTQLLDFEVTGTVDGLGRHRNGFWEQGITSSSTGRECCSQAKWAPSSAWRLIRRTIAIINS